MKPIEARKQVKLGLGRCLQLALTGMSYRLFRSGVTVAILALAVAFLVHMFAHGLMEGRVQSRAWSLLAADRGSGELLTRLSSEDGRAAILDRLAAAAATDTWDTDPRLAEYRAWIGDDAVAALQPPAGRLAEVEQYFNDLPEKQRIVLTGGLEGVTLLNRLAQPGRLAGFRDSLDGLSLQPPLGSFEAFSMFVGEDWAALLRGADAVAAGHGRALSRVGSSFREATPVTLLQNDPGRLGPVLDNAGFEVEEAELASASAFAGDERDLAALNRALSIEAVRRAVAVELDTTPLLVSLDGLMDWLTREARAGRLLAEIEPVAGYAGDPAATAALLGLTPGRVLELAQRYRSRRTLRAAVEGSPYADAERGSASGASASGRPEEAGGTLLSLPQRTLWLILLSALVCTIGVANAMLMSVTERFTEIATMKCLGAMDGFVMSMFVFEAMIQGIVGGILGAVLGLVLAVLRIWLEYGSLASFALDAAGQVAWATLISLGVGLLLATLAAVGPSFVAARLAPMEAMRVE